MTRGRGALLAAGLLALAAPRGLAAQHIFEVSGGGSSLHHAYGATANFWGSRYDGWLGVGHQDGFRVGAFARLFVFGDTIRMGNDVVTVRMPTDIFTPSPNILVQGLGYAYGRGQTRVRTFAGASAIGLSSPYFAAARGSYPMLSVAVSDSIGARTEVAAHAIAAKRQSLFASARYERPDSIRFAFTGGVGANHPYVALSTGIERRWVTVRGAYVYREPGFRRAEVSMPNQAETERENVELTFHPRDNFSVGVERKHYVQDSIGTSVPKRSVGNAVFATGTIAGLRLNTGVYFAESDAGRATNGYVSAGRRIASWLDADAYYLRADAHELPPTSTIILQVRERVSNRLRLMQQVTREASSTRFSLGGGILTSTAELSADYQVYYLPLQSGSPFRTVLSIQARIQLGQYATNFGTTIMPDGTVGYSAMGSTFLYYGDGTATGLRPVRIQFDKFVVRGQVLDEEGKPVEGAALTVGTEMVFTDSRGEFFLRVGSLRPAPLAVELQEFLLPGYWEVVSAPQAAQPMREEEVRPIRVVLRRAQAPAPPAAVTPDSAAARPPGTPPAPR